MLRARISIVWQRKEVQGKQWEWFAKNAKAETTQQQGIKLISRESLWLKSIVKDAKRKQSIKKPQS